MIETDAEYRAARLEALRLAHELARFDLRPIANLGTHPSRVAGEFKALRERLETLREELRDCDIRRLR